VGHGCGDSLLLHLSNTNVPLPLSLTGITSLPEQHAQASLRLHRCISSTAPELSSPQINLYLGDAIFTPGLNPTSPHASKHPLDPDSPSMEYFMSIHALDCAYHFHTRELFLSQCFLRLKPVTGRISLADMCFEPSSDSSRISIFFGRCVARMLSVPSSNLVTREEYRRQMECIGYTDIVIEDISMDVFPGFTTFLSTKGFLWKLFARIIRLWWVGGGKFVLVSGRRQG
jgi:hypothetical protein